MANIITRSTKGAPLTFDELDANFVNLNAAVVDALNISDVVETWNDSTISFNGFKLSVTDTASAASSLLMDLQLNGSSKLNLTKDGNLGIGISPTSGIHQLGGGIKLQALSTPSAPTLTTIGTAGITSYSYYVIAEDRNGKKTLPSLVGTISTGNATLDTTNYNTVSWSSVPGAVKYYVLKTDTSTLLSSTTALTFNDQGQATSVFTAPTRNETADLTVDGQITVPTLVGTVSGNASSATVLQTARSINGVNFDGSANITITSNTTNALTIGSYLTGLSFNGSAAVTIAVDATSANTASKVVVRDASGNFSAGVITASLTGNASSATVLQTARSINGVNFDGSANITITSNTTNILTLGSYLLGTSFNGSAAVTASVDATSTNTASKVVVRDASGNFDAGTVSFTGINLSISTKTAAYTVTANDYTILGDATAAAFSVTLPAAPQTGMIVVIKKIDSSANAVTIDGNTKTIDGVTTKALSTQYTSARVQYNGTSWWVI